MTIDVALTRFLAAKEATETSKFFDTAPGNIMHEMREGETVKTVELPFSHY